MKRRLLLLISIIVVGSLVFAFIPEKDSRSINPGERTITGRSISSPAIDITYNNLPEYLSKNAVIRDIPDDTEILLRFFNFNTGSREYENTFILTKGDVKEGSTTEPALTMEINSKYLNEWNSRNFCQIMTKANNNGDLGYSSDLSTAKLLWKFKSMNKHKSCFGM